MLLIGGRCPACDIVHLRNICNAQFVADLVEPRLQLIYSKIKEVTVIMTTDLSFNSTVGNLGGRVLRCIDKDEIARCTYLQIIMCDFHPNISTTVKELTQIAEGELIEEADELTTWRVCSELFTFPILLIRLSNTFNQTV